MKTNEGKELDAEWMMLIREALDMGLKQEEIRDFLHNSTEITSKK